mmetsp:Transcript_39233/g.68155  ORF Transcript_39233/g.68155 Transcript_39233/m.68155 type:complete len:290 (-) Transcript_39233:2-871(-)
MIALVVCIDHGLECFNNEDETDQSRKDLLDIPCHVRHQSRCIRECENDCDQGTPNALPHARCQEVNIHRLADLVKGHGVCKIGACATQDAQRLPRKDRVDHSCKTRRYNAFNHTHLSFCLSIIDTAEGNCRCQACKKQEADGSEGLLSVSVCESISPVTPVVRQAPLHITPKTSCKSFLELQLGIHTHTFVGICGTLDLCRVSCCSLVYQNILCIATILVAWLLGVISPGQETRMLISTWVLTNLKIMGLDMFGHDCKHWTCFLRQATKTNSHEFKEVHAQAQNCLSQK